MKNWIEIMEQTFRRSFYFFPLQLFFLHLKKNITLLLLWGLVFAITLGWFGSKYGVPTLFLAPEYLSQVDFRSFFIFGFSVGSFVLSFNLFSYVMNGYRFPFLATLSTPFYKYSTNNTLFPTAFIITYIICSAHFQYVNELLPISSVVINLFSFIIGYFLFMLLGMSYFITTNKSAMMKDEKEDNENINPVNLQFHKRDKWDFGADRKHLPIVTYLSSPFKIRLARDISHYKPETIRKIFRQNRLNASFFQLFMIAVFIIIGLFSKYPFFMIPAGASIMLLFTILIMVFSAFNSWLRSWSTFVILLVILSINYASQFDYLQYENKAYGLDYQNVQADYSSSHILEMANDSAFHQRDKNKNIKILNNWKKKQGVKKPKIIFIATSGGGLRSSMWTYYVLGKTDSVLHHDLLKSTFLITGSSGGMIGAAFMRQLYKEKLDGNVKKYFADSLAQQIGSDLLNPVGFSIVTNDLFIRTQHFKYDGQKYLKDRGYAFEHQLNISTNHVLDVQFKDFKLDVLQAKIPAMIFTPTIVNDSRKLLISNLPVSFLTSENPDQGVDNNALPAGVDFEQLFGEKALSNLRLSSAVRMSASFPYILPSVSLPSKPQISVMDAGVRDNYGISTAVHYIYNMRKWLEQNTSGIIILSIRSSSKHSDINAKPILSMLQKITSPLGVYYDHIFAVQDFHNDQYIQYMSGWYNGKIDIIPFELTYSKKKYISLSLHLTSREKKEIQASLNSPSNIKSFKKLIRLNQR